ncbi:MAG: hypothetical protein HLUCCO03_15545 [Marinobacter sp. HL-58]|nr:MAG: hypothetical protein HLUCCO03_15545 [Marinobacter sp. HL-58]
MVVTTNKWNWLVGGLALVTLLVITWTFYQHTVWAGPVMSAGVSDSGRYVITTHRNNELILWDIESKDWKTVHTKANLYSASFVPGKHAFVWQDLTDQVTVQTIDGERLLRFPHFATYGHTISEDLNTYLSTDENWNVFKGSGANLKPILQDGISPSFEGSGKLLNLSMAREGNFFVTSGFGDDIAPIEDYPPVDQERRFSRYSGVTFWNAETGKPIAKFQGNTAKTHAVISPDGKWIISGDENGNGFYWDTSAPEERYRLANYYSGIYIDDTPFDMGDARNWDKEGLIDAPQGLNDFTIAQAFIHNSEYYLRFGNNSHIAALFKAGSPWPVKYFDLGESPELVTYGSNYSRNTAIATSPEAGVLVMGHRTGGGISVYHFDADNLTLNRTWVVE